MSMPWGVLMITASDGISFMSEPRDIPFDINLSLKWIFSIFTSAPKELVLFINYTWSFATLKYFKRRKLTNLDLVLLTLKQVSSSFLDSLCCYPLDQNFKGKGWWISHSPTVAGFCLPPAFLLRRSFHFNSICIFDMFSSCMERKLWYRLCSKNIFHHILTLQKMWNISSTVNCLNVLKQKS